MTEINMFKEEVSEPENFSGIANLLGQNGIVNGRINVGSDNEVLLVENWGALAWHEAWPGCPSDEAGWVAIDKDGQWQPIGIDKLAKELSELVDED